MKKQTSETGGRSSFIEARTRVVSGRARRSGDDRSLYSTASPQCDLPIGDRQAGDGRCSADHGAREVRSTHSSKPSAKQSLRTGPYIIRDDDVFTCVHQLDAAKRNLEEQQQRFTVTTIAEMLSIATPAYSDPSRYELVELPRPTVSEPTDVLIQVHAASINPIDVKLAAGMLKMAVTDEFPFKLGYDCAGVVIEVGKEVARIKVGDEVYARISERDRGSWSEYAKCAEHLVALKPETLSFADASALPLAAVTALQALRKYKGSLSGKTVFVPAGLGGSGSFACQLAKNVFHAGKVITTVSTSKVDRVPELLGEGVVDQVIDYTKNNPTKIIPRGTIDFILDTTGQAMQFLSLVTPSTGVIISISTMPSGDQLQTSSFFRRPDNPRLPWIARIALNIANAISQLRARRWGVQYEYLFLESNAEDLDLLSAWVKERKVAPVVGSRTDLRDIEKVRATCDLVYKGKGGLGKAVIDIIRD